MELQRSAIIQYSTKKTCFMGIPASWATSSVTHETVFELEFGPERRIAYFTWSGEITKRDSLIGSDIVEICGLYANKLNIVEGDIVLIKQLSGIATCEKVWVESISEQDLEILELNVNLVQTQLLNQTRIVWRNQELPVWINKSVVVYLRVVKLSVSSECGLLMELSEIHVQDEALSNPVTERASRFVRHENEINSRVITNTTDMNKLDPAPIPAKKDSEAESSNTILNRMVECIAGLVENLYITKETVPAPHKVQRKLDVDDEISQFTVPFEFNALFRVNPVPKMNMEKIEQPETRTLLKQMTNVYIFANSLPKNVNVSGLPSFFICRLVKVLSQETVQKKNNNVSNSKSSNKSNTERPDLRIECCFVKVVLIDRTNSLSLSWTNVLNDYAVCFIPNNLRRHFGLEISCKVCLEAKDFKPCDVRSISIHLFNPDLVDSTKTETLLETVENKLKKMSSNYVPLVASNGTLLQLTLKDITFDVLLSFNNSSSSSLVIFDVGQLKESIFLGVPAVELAKSTDSIKLPQFSHVRNMVLPFVFNDAQSLGAFFAEIQSGVEFLQLSLGLGHMSSALGYSLSDKSGALLVTGSRGSGKSSVAKAICARLSSDPNWVYVKLIECKNLKGKKVENIFDAMRKALTEATFRAPSILLLDNLDVICKSPTQNEGDAGNSYLDHLAQAFSNLSAAICSQVSLLVTATSKEFLHPFLSNPKGRHFFHKCIAIPALDQEKRMQVLHSVIRDFPLDSDASLKAVNLSEIASQLEGGVARDLRLVLDRAVHSACARLRTDCRNVVLDQSDFQCALDGFTPSALKGMSCHGESGKSWQDIGGLHRVKKVLQEIFLWPSKYPKLFANCPLQLSSGVLLYGPPGTGKTLLASAVAKECSLNFISVKGPELLSKYIGASEQAVRDLFLRALAARPSVIFFDEFDALAPRRGHDSTGVTDRVVNQLLTQLDGIEGRQGVYILAATSRPDLIDPALLRPGRLDKCLHCPLPTKEEIKEMMHILTLSMTNLDRSLVDFDRVVCHCEHFSGADVQSVLYSAQLMAIHSCCDAPSVRIPRTSDAKDELWVHCPTLEDGFVSDMPEWKRDEISRELDLKIRRTIGPQYGLVNCGKVENESERQIVAVTEEMLIEAAKQTKPSVSATERRKYQIIYEKFMKSRTGFGDANSVANNIQQKATLA